VTVLATWPTMRIWFAEQPVIGLDKDGLPFMPGPQQADGSIFNGASLLGANGFANTWTAVSQGNTTWGPTLAGPVGPLIATAVPGGDLLFPLLVTCNAFATDGGVDSFAWYLSQGVDPVRLASIDYPTTIQPANNPQLFTVTQLDRVHSGTVVIGVNASEVVKLFPSSGGVPPTDAGSLLTMFMNCWLLVSRRSDQAYQGASFVYLGPPPQY
jgi:hypothetical protein